MEKLSRLTRKMGPLVTVALTGGLTMVVLFVMLSTAITPERYDIQVGEVATTTIIANKDVKDTIATQQKIDEAVRAVQPHYITDDEAQQKTQDDIENAFKTLIDIKSSTAPEELAEKIRTEMAPVEFTDEQIATIASLTVQEISDLASATRRLVRSALNTKVLEGQESEAIVKVSQDLLNGEYGSEAVDVAAAIVRAYMRANMKIDEAVTEENRQEARDSVEDVIYKKGQKIIEQGEVVTENQIAMLDSLGMLESKGVDFTLYLGVGLLLIMLLLVIVLYLKVFEPEMLMDPRRIALLCCIVVVVILLCLLLQKVNVYLMPVTLGVMLTAILLKPRLALITNIILAVMAGLLAFSSSTGMFTAAMFGVMMTSIVSGSLCLGIVKTRQQRLSIMMAGLAVAVSNMLTTIAVGLINNASRNDVFVWALWSAGSGILSAVLCIGLQPLLEWLFNLVTSAKLLELSNPNHPLLRRLLLEAPGTYHHSIIVANLAEAAASSVGANGLLARVGAYYHDVVKLKRPMYFKENQMGDNPHDRTDPRVSTAILTAHPRDGVQMAIKHRIPEPILDIIQQHHGDTPVLYFYDKAVKQGDAVNIADFRYDGPRPRSREAAIVMLADTVEAAARALPDPNLEKMDALIRKLVRGKMEDRQLDECTLTFSDLDKICKAFLTVLTGVFHERIEYPNIDVAAKVAQDTARLQANALKKSIEAAAQAQPAASQKEGKQ